MDKTIEQLGQDLALAKYAKSTRIMYLSAAEHLVKRFKRPPGEITRALCISARRSTW
jgi:hypothetical protein